MNTIKTAALVSALFCALSIVVAGIIWCFVDTTTNVIIPALIWFWNSGVGPKASIIFVVSCTLMGAAFGAWLERQE